ncbi:MAG: universal stress protein [Burkholderiales bacterium]
MSIFEKILVPIDGNELSQRAVDEAIEYCKRSGCKLTVLYVRPLTPIAHPVAFGDYFDTEDDTKVFTPTKFRERLISYGNSLLTTVEGKCKSAGVECETVLEASDDPHEKIIETAERRGIGMIFMASRGRSGLRSMLLGSETQKVLSHSKIPVLVFR